MEGVAGRRGSPGEGGRREGRGGAEGALSEPLEQEAAGSQEGRAGVRPRGALEGGRPPGPVWREIVPGRGTSNADTGESQAGQDLSSPLLEARGAAGRL